MMLHRVLKFFSLLVSVLMLTACNQAPPPEPHIGPRPLTSYQHHLLFRIESGGAVVIKQGSMLKIILPTNTFFHDHSTRIKFRKIDTVEDIATLMKSYIESYRQPRIVILSDSNEYARKIAEILWDLGVSRRWMNVRTINPSTASRTTVPSIIREEASRYSRRIVIQIN